MHVLTRHGICTFMLTSLLLALPALRAHSQEEAQPAAGDESWRDKSERQLRRELRDAEEAFFDSFNAVNSDKQYDVLCKTSAPLGSRKRERKCQARFLWDYEEELAENYARRSIGAPGPGVAATSNVQDRLDVLRAEMSAAMSEHAEVADAFAALNEAKRRYELKLAEQED